MSTQNIHDHHSTPTPEAEEFIRLKLELAQTRSRTDATRLQARRLISERTTLRESAAKTQVDTEEQRLILAEAMQSIHKLKIDLKKTEEERDVLKQKLNEKNT